MHRDVVFADGRQSPINAIPSSIAKRAEAHLSRPVSVIRPTSAPENFSFLTASVGALSNQ